MTPRQLTLARQALDDWSMPGCAVVNIGHPDNNHWSDMAHLGLATVRRLRDYTCGSYSHPPGITLAQITDAQRALGIAPTQETSDAN